MNGTIVGLHKAAEVAGVSFMTIKEWTVKYAIGEKIDHQWHIDAAKLEQVIQARKHLKMLRA